MVLAFEGIVEDGRVPLPADVHLPEGMKVYVVVPSMEARRTFRVMSPRLANREDAKDFVLEIDSEAGDAEAQT